MNHQWYKSAPAKGILIVLAHVLVVAIAAGFVWIMSYPMLRTGAGGKGGREVRGYGEF